MNYRRNKKYFEQVNKVYPIVIAAALIAIGFIMVVFLAGTHGLPQGLMMMIGLPLLVVGVILATTISAVRIKDSEIDENAASLCEAFEGSFNEKFVKTDVRRYKNEQRYGDHSSAHHTEPIFFGTYFFDDEHALFKRGGDGRERSSVYSLSGFMLKPASICIGERYVDITDGSMRESFIELPYTSLSGVRYEDTEASDKVYVGKTKYRHIILTRTDGTTAADLPVLAAADADLYIDEIGTRISRAGEQQGIEYPIE